MSCGTAVLRVVRETAGGRWHGACHFSQYARGIDFWYNIRHGREDERLSLREASASGREEEKTRDFRYGKLPLPVGKSDWEEVAGHCYCVDKTLLMRDLLATRAGVALFTRPRRFGKTTAMQMLKCFFEKRGADEPDVRHLFESRAIAKCDRADEWMSHQGKYPVIYLTFKDHKALTWESAQYNLRYDIGSEFARHKAAMASLADQDEVDLFDRIKSKTCSMDDLAKGLGLLAKALHLHHKEKPFVIVDEYDSPVTSASTNGYYTEMVNFMRVFLSGAMKDNNHVKMGVMTESRRRGCSRDSTT